MSRRRRHSERGRDLTNSITNDIQPQTFNNLFQSLLPAPVVDPAIEDRRRYHPLKEYAPPQATRRYAAGLVLRGAHALQTKAPIGFRAPNQVMICVRRKQRKEIMHAKRHAGKGGMRKPKRNIWSDIKC